LMIGYAVHRFINESIRIEPVVGLGLTLSQWGSVVIFAAAVAIEAYLWRGVAGRGAGGAPAGGAPPAPPAAPPAPAPTRGEPRGGASARPPQGCPGRPPPRRGRSREVERRRVHHKGTKFTQRTTKRTR